MKFSIYSFAQDKVDFDASWIRVWGELKCKVDKKELIPQILDDFGEEIQKVLKEKNKFNNIKP
jgi:hypothetical protein